MSLSEPSEDWVLMTHHRAFCMSRPFWSSKNSHFQNEAKCKAFLVKISFICIRIRNHFHIQQQLHVEKEACSNSEIVY